MDFTITIPLSVKELPLVTTIIRLKHRMFKYFSYLIQINLM